MFNQNSAKINLFIRTALCFAAIICGIGGITATAQKAARAKAVVNTESRLEIENSAASSDGETGVYLQWSTSLERGNVGFKIYRLENGTKVLVSKSLIPGSVFKGESDLQKSYAYSHFDLDGSLDAQYIIEALDINGKKQEFAVTTVFDSETLTRANHGADSGYQKAQAERGATSEPFANQTETLKVGDAQPVRNIVDAEKQRWVAGRPGVKIEVCSPYTGVAGTVVRPECKGSGLYRLTRQQLTDAGFNLTSQVSLWQLYVDGIEQTVIVSGVEPDGTLGANGYLEFYGTPLERTSYSTSQMYYLVVGDTAGRRMNFINGRGYTTKVSVPSYISTVEYKSRGVYFSALANGEKENFFGDFLFFPDATDLPINLKGVSTAGNATIEVSVQGVSATTNHNIEVYLNNNPVPVGTVTGFGRALMQGTFTFSASLLVEGANKIKLKGTTSGEFSVVDYARLSYPRKYQAVDEKLQFVTAFNRAVRVTGFTSPDIRVFDVTDNGNYGIFNHIQSQDNGIYSAMILNSRPRMMYAVAGNAVLTGVVTANTPSDIYNTALNKNFIVVTTAALRPAAQSLADYRASALGGGFSTTVVNIEDVFDEFSFGQLTPHALKPFFQRIRNESMTQYTVLVGDANVDSLNYMGTGFHNAIPTTVNNSPFGEFVSDERMSDLNDNNVADIAIGRFTARSLTEANVLVNKVKNFEASLLTGHGQNSGGVYVADCPEGYEFDEINHEMGVLMPGITSKTFVTRCNGEAPRDLATVRQEIVNGFNTGPVLVNYAGHGTIPYWASAQIFRNSDANGLTNGQNKLSLYVLLTCLNGAFGDFENQSLGETVVKAPNGGGAMLWGSSALTVAAGQHQMASKFYELWNDPTFTGRLGDHIVPAKNNTFDPNVQLSWILMGDPAMKIK